jgi:hypothetical protein
VGNYPVTGEAFKTTSEEHMTPRHVFLVILFCATASMCMADDILGKQISFKTQYGGYQLRILKDGHIFMTTSGSDCRSPSGQIGGEAIIGQSLTREFTCYSRRGQQQHHQLNSNASFSGGVLDITETWSSNVASSTTTQHTVLTINGNRCSGTASDSPVINCSVR